jgi:hypothetical protein
MRIEVNMTREASRPSSKKSPMKAALLAAAVALIPLAACSNATPFEPQVIETTDFFVGLGIDLASMTKLPSGVYIQDDSVGTGAALADGDSVQIDHRGWLSNGYQFSGGIFRSLYPTSFIDGFSIGMEGMAEGGQRLMIIPPELAYGNAGSGPIPRGAVLVFEVELIDAY